MIVLHAAFCEGGIHFWCEPDGGREVVRAALSNLGIIPPALDAPEEAVVWLPTMDGKPVPSMDVLAEQPVAEQCYLAPSIVHVVSFAPEDTMLVLAALKGKHLLAPAVLTGGDLRYWTEALSYAASLVSRGLYLPSMHQEGDQSHARWTPVFAGPDAARMHALAKAMPPAARAMTLHEKEPDAAAETVLTGFLTLMADTFVRYASADRRTSVDGDTVNERWMKALTSSESRVAGPSANVQAFARQVADWRRPVQISAEAAFRLCFRLSEPNADGGTWEVEYVLQGSRDPSLFLPAHQVWKPKANELKKLGADPRTTREVLLSSLGQASSLCSQVEQSLSSAAPEGFLLDTPAAHAFLTTTAPQLEQAGFGVLLPNWWHARKSGLRLQARAVVKAPKAAGGSGLSLDAILDFNWELALGGSVISKQELLALARQKGQLVKLRGQWVEVNAAEIADAVKFLDRGVTQATAGDLFRMAIGASTIVDGFEAVEVKATGWFGDLLQQLESRTPARDLDQPAGLTGQLRHYQLRGFSWVEALKRFGLGACLADDMGLGKTIQTLALIQHDVSQGQQQPVLLVCPTSVVGNWQKEAAKFTPQLAVLVHHGSQRAKGESFASQAAKHQIVLCSYALLHRDSKMLREVEWAGVILDEAQNIKNSETLQSRAARTLSSGYRVALTGTPVENNVGDLWSIMEFLNPGLMGSWAAFKKRYFVPIQVYSDEQASGQLKRLTGPFVLRREKTDKSIIADLPDKIEMKVYCNLTKEQASLYEAVVVESQEAIESADGIQRKGIVLATLTKLKQVCNHPAQFLQDKSVIPGRSGKLSRLTEMLEETLAIGDRCLLFTQFAEMGHLLQTHLRETFGVEVLYLHGGSSRKQRDEMVSRFSAEKGPKLFVLSLKAGGTGLNLTTANHVFHIDRWWNPAVENQATDRAFRIGQTRNVQVHKFVCAGTVEERIDEMIERKKEIAGKVVAAGETWISELSNKELRSLFALRKDAVNE